jgi:hypothetical protein
VKSLGELLGLGTDARLSKDLKRLFRHSRMAMYVSEGDPGRDVLMHDARRTAMRAMKRGDLVLEVIPGADHTLSQSKPRADLLERLITHFTQRMLRD